MLDYTIEIVNDQFKLDRLVNRLAEVRVAAVDLETVNWWNRQAEQIALVQLAFRTGGKLKVAIVDALANLDLEPLRAPFESSVTTKVMHNAAFDATKLAAHLKFRVAPVFDTMLAARRSGEKQYSLQAQADQYLNLRLDKAGQRADWSRRPLDPKLIAYAALDAVAALLLYEQQLGRGLDGRFELKTKLAKREQPLLPLADEGVESSPAAAADPPGFAVRAAAEQLPADQPLELPTLALLGVIAELPSRYYPEQLAASVGVRERAGLTGWILDQMLGADAEVDEATVKLAIGELCAAELICVTQTRRLEATDNGTQLWRRLKPKNR